MAEVCISQQQHLLTRWQQAFPNGVVLDSLSALDNDGQFSTIWLHEEGLSIEQVVQALQQLAQLNLAARLVVVTSLPNNSNAMLYFQHGAVGYCHILATPSLLQQVALVVDNGGLWLGPELMNQFAGALGRTEAPAESLDLEKLSVRERQVALQIATGASNKEVAQTLAITERTVKAHMSSILEKLALRDRLQLALLISPQKN